VGKIEDSFIVENLLMQINNIFKAKSQSTVTREKIIKAYGDLLKDNFRKIADKIF
jgi:hypothetical protein